MIDVGTLVFIARASSAITSIIGVVLLIYMTIVIKHLVKDNFRKILFLMGIFFLVALLGVISMTSYHFLDGTGQDQLIADTNILWYLLMFISMPISVYGSYIVISFGKSILRIGEKSNRIRKRNKKRK